MVRFGKVLAAILVTCLLLYAAVMWAGWELREIGRGSNRLAFDIGVFVIFCSMGLALVKTPRRDRKLQSRWHQRIFHH